MGCCKVLDKCKKCYCCKEKGLAEQIQVPRPTERVIERDIVELATRCEACCNCESNKEN